MATKNKDSQNLTCPECQTINPRNSDFCRKCGYPFELGTLDPIVSLSRQRSALARWVERPSRLGLAVMWLTHFPLLFLSLGVAVNIFQNRTGLGDFVLFWAMVLIAMLAAAFLYLTTKNYLKQRKAKSANRQ